MDACDLLGRWKLLRARGPSPEHSIEFTAGGDLVYSIARSDGLERLLLTFEVDGYTLVTDQLSAPRQDRVPAVVTLDGELVIGEGPHEVRYACADPDAALFALANRALHDAVGRATGEAFLESLWWYDGGWKLERIVGAEPAAAHAAARERARGLPPGVEACSCSTASRRSMS